MTLADVRLRSSLLQPTKESCVFDRLESVLAGIDAVSSDYRAEPGMVLPTIRVKAVRGRMVIEGVPVDRSGKDKE